MSFFSGLFGGGGGGSQAAGNASQALYQAMLGANQALQGYGQRALGRYDKNYFDPYSKAGNQGIGMLVNALGLGGPGGTAQAQQAFKVGPGYQFALNQGLQGVDRGAAARGLLGSGNAAMALNDYAQGIANQEYGNWLNRLTGLGDQGLRAAGGQLGRQGAMAGIDQWIGQGLGQNYMNTAQNYADIYLRGQDQDRQAQALGAQNLFSAILGGLKLGL